MNGHLPPPPEHRRSKVWRETYNNAIRRGATPDQAHRLATTTADAWKRRR